jgi:hypothetical protein
MLLTSVVLRARLLLFFVCSGDYAELAEAAYIFYEQM